MYILHIETSTKICSVALSKGEEVLGTLDLSEGTNHTAMLAPAIDQLLTSRGVQPSQLQAISVSTGPGSYTGLRVGSSTAKAMAYTLQIPILAVPTLLSLAGAAFERYPQAELAIPMCDARRDEVYAAIYDRQLDNLVPVSSLILQRDINDFLPAGKVIVMIGDGAEKLNLEGSEIIIIDTTILCNAVHLVKPALAMMVNREWSDALHFVPFYMKPPNITKQKSLT